MKMKRIISALCSLAMMVSMFGAFAMTASAANGPIFAYDYVEEPTTTNKQAVVNLVIKGLAAGTKVTGVQFATLADADFPFVYQKANVKVAQAFKDVEATQQITADAGAAKAGKFAVVLATDVGVTVPADGNLVIATLTLPYKEAPAVDATYELKVAPTDGQIVADGTTYKMAEGGITAENKTIIVTEQKEEKAPTIEKIEVTPATATVAVGAKTTFAATGTGDGGWDLANNKAYDINEVTWDVEPKAGGSTISATGELTVGANETAETLTVTATSKHDTSKKATATVTVKQKGAAAVAVTATANTAVGKYTTQKLAVSADADADADALKEFTDAVTGKTVVVSVLGKTASDVVVGTAYLTVDGATLAAITAGGSVDLGSVGIIGAAKYEVTLIADGTSVVPTK